MPSTMHKEYLKLGKYLWERIDATDNRNVEALKALGTINYL